MMVVEPEFRDSADPEINSVKADVEPVEYNVEDEVIPLRSKIAELESTILELKSEITRLKAVNYDLLTAPSVSVDGSDDVDEVEDTAELDLYDLFKEA